MNQHDSENPADPLRRRIMRALVAAPAVASPFVGLGCVAARAQSPSDAKLAAATMGLISTNVSSLMPATTQGPFYLDPRLARSDITENRPGAPLRLNIQLVTADGRPLAGARVDVWQCDAQGNYSGFAEQGSDHALDTERQTFLRGAQRADANGIVTFDTIYPGWYHGRTTHIHYKVLLDGNTILTSQIFFPDALSQYLYENAKSYRRAGARDTANSTDGIAAQAGEGAYCAIREQRDRYVAALVVGLDPKSEWREADRGMGGPPPGPPPNGGRPPPPPSGGGIDPTKIRMFPGG